MQSECLHHGQPIVYYKRNKSQLRGLCSQCIATDESQMILASDLQKQVDDQKDQLMMVIQEEFIKNNSYLDDLKFKLTNFKNNKLKLIDEIFVMIEQSKVVIQKDYNQTSKSLQLFQKLDSNDLIEYFISINDKSTVYKQQSLLNQLFDDLKQSNFFIDSEVILKNFPYSIAIQKEQEPVKQYGISNLTNCTQHSKQIVAVDLDETLISDQLFCVECIQIQQRPFQSIDSIQNLWNDFLNFGQNSCFNFKEKLETMEKLGNECIESKIQNLKNKFNNYSQLLNKIKNQNIGIINQQINNINCCQLDLSNNLDVHKIIEIQNNIQNYKTQFGELIKQFEKKLKEQDFCLNFQNMRDVLDNINQLRQLLIVALNDKIEKNREFKLINDSTIKLNGWCSCLAINSNDTILAAGQDSNIKIYQFNKEKLKEQQTLKGHSERVLCLEFMKNSNKFISGSKDQRIKIWNQDQNENWIQISTLQGHSNWIYCLKIKTTNDLIISCGIDKSIKFWNSIENEWSCQQTISIHSDIVFSLSLDISETKLISCGKDKSIYIFECDSNKVWNKIQQIKTEQIGYRLCFISNNLFVFQPILFDYMQVYEFDNKEFHLKKSIKVKQNKRDKEDLLFPQQYNQQKQILISKNGQVIDILKFTQDGKIQYIQSIDCLDQCTFGTITNNGDYLLTWDWNLKEIQIRKYQEI